MEVREWAQNNALLDLAVDGEPAIIQLLAESGVDLNARDQELEGRTALMLATEFRNTELVEALVKVGANVNLKDDLGRTALMFACVFRTDLERKEKILKICEKQIHLIKLLATAGADLEIQDEQGKTALIHAAEHGSPKAVAELLKIGASTQAIDTQGHDALFYAENRENIFQIDKIHRSEIIGLLCKTGE